MKFETIEISGWEGAIKGMRNPLESWHKSDSGFKYWCNCLGPNEEPHFCENCNYDACNPYTSEPEYIIGKNDLDLMTRLIKAGSEHRKFLRYIHVQVDITAPLYWWKEFDTYKVGTVANSTSTMHKLASTPITLDCFEIDDLNDENMPIGNYNCLKFMYNQIIDDCENLRKKYLETKDIRYWKELIRWLPESWLQTRTVDLNYEVLRTIVRQRTGHKLTEWRESFINWVHTLPYADELIFSEEAITTEAKDCREFKKAYEELCKMFDDNPPVEQLNTIIKQYLFEK